MKTFFLIVLIVILGIFIYLKVQVGGSPDSSFNQTTRFSLAASPFMRTILGLHSVGDSRSEYLKPGGPIQIIWFKPQSENDDYVNTNLMDKFASLVGNYTGRISQAIYGGAIDDAVIPVTNLKSYYLKTSVQSPGSTVILVFFTKDYSPRPQNELSTTYLDSGMALSLDSHRNFLQNYAQDLDAYLLASMLHEFGNQIGMQENPSPQADPFCIMNLHAGVNGTPVEASGYSEPQDFCPIEQTEIKSLKAEFAQ